MCLEGNKNLESCSEISCKDYREILEVIRRGNVDEVRLVCSKLDSRVSRKATKLMSELYGRLIEILGDVGKLFDFIAEDSVKAELYSYFRGYQIPYEVVRCMRMSVLIYNSLMYNKHKDKVDCFIGVSKLLESDIRGYFTVFSSVSECDSVASLHEMRVSEDELREEFLGYVIRGDYLSAYNML